MHIRLLALTAALMVRVTPVWATVLPTYETYSAAADIGTNFFTSEPYIPQSSITTIPGETASITQISPIPISNPYTASATTILGSNHAFARASSLPLGGFGIGSFSGWYDRVTITGGTGTGTAYFTVQLHGMVDVGAIAGTTNYALMTSGIHPSVLGTNVIVDAGTPTSPWILIASEINPVIGYNLVASPYNDPNQFSGLFGATPPPGGIPAITDPAYILGNDTGMGFPAPDLVLTPGAGQDLNVTLHGTLNFTYGEEFYLISTLGTDLPDLSAFQPFCPLGVVCPSNPPVDGTGATMLDFSNSANLINIALPEGATASFASGNDYNVTNVPEPSSIALMGLGVMGMGLIGWRTHRKTA